jgi:hypothetical protein
MRIPDDIPKCVAFLGIEVPKDHQSFWDYRGTGFVIRFAGKKAAFYYLATAKHVAVKAETSKFTVRYNTKDGKSRRYFLQPTEGAWHYHPNDTSADAAITPFPVQDDQDRKAVPFDVLLTDKDIRSGGNIGIGNETIMTGLFTQHQGLEKNLPIVRTGNVAMIPDEPVHTKSFGAMDAYLIEARSTQGLSGSPVFVRYHDTPVTEKLGLLGLIHGHYDEKRRRGDKGSKTKPDPVNVGIAIVVPAQKLIDIILGKELTNLRDEIESER